MILGSLNFRSPEGREKHSPGPGQKGGQDGAEDVPSRTSRMPRLRGKKVMTLCSSKGLSHNHSKTGAVLLFHITQPCALLMARGIGELGAPVGPGTGLSISSDAVALASQPSRTGNQSRHILHVSTQLMLFLKDEFVIWGPHAFWTLGPPQAPGSHTPPSPFSSQLPPSQLCH